MIKPLLLVADSHSLGTPLSISQTLSHSPFSIYFCTSLLPVLVVVVTKPFSIAVLIATYSIAIFKHRFGCERGRTDNVAAGSSGFHSAKLPRDDIYWEIFAATSTAITLLLSRLNSAGKQLIKLAPLPGSISLGYYLPTRT